MHHAHAHVHQGAFEARVQSVLVPKVQGTVLAAHVARNSMLVWAVLYFVGNNLDASSVTGWCKGGL